MKRFLSHIVIFALLVVSPISFSTSKIQNFYILVTVDAPLQESRKTGISVSRRAVTTIEQILIANSPPPSFVTLPVTSATLYKHDIEHGRAPPVFPSV